ncbi:hypothetical protein COV12_00845 [Candidatus Woesearchaeota archaeon CG10_big_fil_rev_8_21_14_0_10_32_24]|nr:MAG: hypothetical protein COV12_00845 [Candidatus Woesearchaeota archaeon CG10_big_fil_rev_8_21_14_0_10_32_24]
MFGLEKKELEVLRKLNTPVKIQNFIDKLKINFEEDGDTCFSPKTVLKKNKCHCAEGAILAALALRVNGYPPLVVDLTSSKNDFDHVVAVFKKNKKWGAISKTNHAVLRYREPVYNSIRELVMSYFHEYFNDDGRKTLRSFSNPVNLSRFDRFGWMNTEGDVYYIMDYLVSVKHFPILTRKQIFNLRKADEIEIKAGRLVEWKSKNAKKNL